MPNCPKCGKEVDHLRCYITSWRIEFYSISVMPDNTVLDDYEFDDDGDIEGEYNYECPLCFETLFKNEWDAHTFLMKDYSHIKPVEDSR